MLIIEIVLTIVAWQRGWKWKALLPTGIAFGIGSIVGFSVGNSGGSLEDVTWVVIFDIIAIIVLIMMCINKPASKSVTPPIN